MWLWQPVCSCCFFLFSNNTVYILKKLKALLTNFLSVSEGGFNISCFFSVRMWKQSWRTPSKVPCTPLEEFRCFSLSLHSWTIGNTPQTTLTQLFGECMYLQCPGLCSFEVEEITYSFIKWQSSLHCLVQQWIMSNNKKVTARTSKCTKCSVKAHRESKCTHILPLTILPLYVAELWIILLCLSWREFSGEDFKRSSGKGEFFSYMKSFLGTFFLTFRFLEVTVT